MSIPAVPPQPNFQNKFPTNEDYHFGLNDSAIDKASKEIEMILKRAENSAKPEKKLQAKDSARNRIHMIFEVDKNNPHVVKSVEVVESNWLSWQFTKLSKRLEGSRNDKTYHFGKGGAIHDLTKFLENLSKEYDSISNDHTLDGREIESVLSADTHFNSTTKKVIQFIELIAPSYGERSAGQSKLRDLYIHHDIAIAQIKIRKSIQSLNSDGADTKNIIMDILEARNSVHFREYHKNPHSEKLFTAFEEVTANELQKANFYQKILELANDGKIDLNQLILNHRPDDSMIPQLKNIQKLKELSPLLTVLENPQSNRLEWIEAGISFIEKFYAIDETARKLTDIEGRFKEIDFAPQAFKHLDAIAAEIKELNTDEADKFAEKYKAFVGIREQLDKVHEKIAHKELGDIKGLLAGVRDAIDENLASKRGEFLQILQSRYEKNVSELDARVNQLQSEQEELELARSDKQRLEETHQEYLSTLTSGQINIGVTLPAGTSELTEKDKALIYALKELLDVIKMTELDTGKKERLNQHLVQANLLPIPVSLSALDYLNSEAVTEKIVHLYRKVSSIQEKASEAVNAAKTKTAEPQLSKKAEIENARQIYAEIVNTEIGMLSELLGSTADRKEVGVNQLFMELGLIELEEDALEAKAEEFIGKLEETFTDHPVILQRIHKLKQQAFDDKFLVKESDKHQHAFLNIAEDMVKRRDNLADEIRTYDNLKFPEFYELKASVLEDMLVKYKERFGLPHEQIIEKDIDEKMGQVIQNKRIDDHIRKQRLTSLLEEKDKMLELVAAFKYNSQTERNAKSSEQQLAEAEAAESGWIQLYLALNHLIKVSASYYKGNEATQNLRELESRAKASSEKISAYETRKQVLAEKRERLIQYYSIQTDLSVAEAMAGLMEHVDEFQSAQI